MPIITAGCLFAPDLTSVDVMETIKHVPLTLPARLRPCSVVALTLFAATSAFGADAGMQVAQVEFSGDFLQRTAGETPDVSRFSNGNPVAPGEYRVDLYANKTWLGRSRVVLKQVGTT